MKQTFSKRLVMLVVTATVAVSVAGCADAPKPHAESAVRADRSDHLIHDSVDKMMVQDAQKSAFGRTAVSDGKITRAEYRTAIRMQVACARDHGIAERTINQYGVYSFVTDGELSGRADRILTRCSSTPESLVATLYTDHLLNPHHRDIRTILVGCLVRSGLAPKNYTRSDYIADTPDSQEVKFPFDANDPRYSHCMINPGSVS